MNKRKAFTMSLIAIISLSFLFFDFDATANHAYTFAVGGPVIEDDEYWKPAYPDYALSGMPDFDQKQNGWFDPTTGRWTYCGPVAIANSLWWLDSKFEPGTVPPPAVSDGFGLVTAYGFWDDHDVNNVVPFVNDLAVYMNTNPQLGTEVHAMKQGIDQYLTTKGMHGYFYIHLMKQPTFQEVEMEVERCQDVVLLLGFWQEDPPGSGMWWRTGGHYVTVAGIDSSALWVALSDPYIDAFEAGLVPGRSPVPHPFPHPPEVHNDAQFVSHDMYWAAMPSPSPSGLWGFPDYNQWILPPDLFYNFERQNCPVEFIQQQMPFNPQLLVYTEVEYAVVTSPWYAKGQYPDYAPSGMPDFDQKQDAWQNPWPPNPGSWSYCGPTSVANSLWWFDSKYEPNPMPPPTYNDGFPLVTTYGFWDDHDPQNVPPLIMDLAWYMDTDGQRTGFPHCGTDVFDMQAGIAHYLSDKGVNPLGDASGDGVVDITDVNIVVAAMGSVPGDPNWDLRADVVHDNIINMADLTLVNAHLGENWGKFYEKTTWMPDYGYLAHQIKMCEDVILLLGFWQEVEPGYFMRIGGHFVTAHGIDEADMMVAISDPFQDNAEQGGQGRVIPPPPHNHPPLPPDTVHNDAAYVSHDYYNIALSPSPGGIWGLPDYNWMPIINNAWGQNTPLNFTGPQEPWMGFPVYVEIEYAVIVSCRGPMVAAGSEDGNVYAFDYMGNLLWTYYTGAPVVSVAMSERGEYVVAGSLNNGLFVFDTAGNLLWSQPIPIAESYDGDWRGSDSKTVGISADGSYIVAATWGGIFLYDNLGNQIWLYSGVMRPEETCVEISPDGRYIVCTNYLNGEIHFFSHLRDGIAGWSPADASPLWTKQKGGWFFNWVAIDGCGRYVAFSADADGDLFEEVYLFNRAGTQVWGWEFDRTGYVRVDMPWDGKSVVAVNADPTDLQGAQLVYFDDMKNGIAGWQAADGTPQWIFVPTPDAGGNDLYSVAMSPDGKVIATGPATTNIYLLSNSGAQIQTLADGVVNALDLTFTGEYGVAGDRVEPALTGTVHFFTKTRSTILWSFTTPGKINSVAIQKIYPCMFPYPNHDIAITNVESRKTVICKGFCTMVNVTVTNEGSFTETFDIELYAQRYSYHNSTYIAGPTVLVNSSLAVMLNPGETKIFSLLWNTTTTGSPKGNYTLTALVSIVEEEIDIYDNSYTLSRDYSHTCSWISIVQIGDVTGPTSGVPDGVVDMRDIYGLVLKYMRPDRYEVDWDTNCDGIIDMKDIYATVLNYMKPDP
jgi:hypothetical protein